MASACRPNQLGSLEPHAPDPGFVSSRIERGVCVHEFCRYACYRPTLAYPDPVTSLCQDISLCNLYNVKLQEYGAYHKFNMKDQGVYSRVVCGVAPARILDFKPDLDTDRIQSEREQCKSMQSATKSTSFSLVTDGPHGCYKYGQALYFNAGPTIETGHNGDCLLVDLDAFG